MFSSVLQHCTKNEAIQDFFSKCDQIRNPQETADLVTFAEEIFNGKLHFLFGVAFVVAY